MMGCAPAEVVGDAMRRLTLRKFISNNKERLGLSGIRETRNTDRRISKPTIHAWQPDMIPPVNSFLVLGSRSVRYIIQRPQLLRRLFATKIAFVFLADNLQPPENWAALISQQQIALAVSRLDEYLLVSRLVGLVKETWEGIKQIQAGLIEMNGLGILLTGGSGLGKTRCSLDLVRQGHRWIADDVVVLEKKSSGVIVGRPHVRTKGLYHLRDKGIQRMADTVGTDALRDEAFVDLVVEFRVSETDRPEGLEATRTIHGKPIPLIRLTGTGICEAWAPMLLDLVHARRLREAYQ